MTGIRFTAACFLTTTVDDQEKPKHFIALSW